MVLDQLVVRETCSQGGFCPLQPEAELGDSDSDAGSDEAKVSKRKKKLESRLKIADLKQVGPDYAVSCHELPIRSPVGKAHASSNMLTVRYCSACHHFKDSTSLL